MPDLPDRPTALGDLLDRALASLAEGDTAILATVVEAEDLEGIRPGTKLLIRADGRIDGTTGSSAIDRAIADEALKLLGGFDPKMIRVEAPAGEPGDRDGTPGTAGRLSVYCEILQPRPKLLIVGAGHVAIPVAKMAKLVGFEVAVLDDRPDFANAERFPEADEVIAADFAEALGRYPIGSTTYIILVTRGHAQDEASLRQVLGSKAPYIGMIGSQRRVRAVFQRLTDAGYDPSLFGKVYAPIGLDIGAHTPEEIAVAIVAEVIKVRRGGQAASLALHERGKRLV
jgi:xanthine dehydrogenase accessory factor